MGAGGSARSLSRTEEPGATGFRRALEDVKRTRQKPGSARSMERAQLIAKKEQYRSQQRGAALPIVVPRRSKKEQLLSPARGKARPIEVPRREKEARQQADEEMRLDSALADDDEGHATARSESP